MRPPLHPTAIIGKKTKLGSGVRVGPFTLIEDDVSIGDNTILLNNVYVGRGTSIGKNNFIFTGSAIGHGPQKKSGSEIQGRLRIGDDNVFREYVTVHKGSDERSATRIGNHNYFMAFSHVGHDCHIQDHVTVTNAVLLGGYATLEDHCVLGGGSGVHQFCRVGRYAMIGGCSTVTKDVPPYMLLDDNETLVGSINIVGLRRAEFSEAEKRDIKRAYQLLYRSGLNTSHALESIVRECHSQSVARLVEFIKTSKRGILGHRERK